MTIPKQAVQEYKPTINELLNELKCRLESPPEPDLEELRLMCDAAIAALTAAAPYMSASAREQALEEAAQNAECHSDDRARRYSMDWNDGYIDGCKGAAAAIRALKSQPAPDGWQPIGVSTPRDQVILAWGNNWHWDGVEKAYLHSDYNGHKNVICRGGMAGAPFTLGRPDAPTHWRPLPPAPQTGDGE